MATKEEMKATLVKLQAEVDNLKKQIETVPSSPDWVKEFLKGEWVVPPASNFDKIIKDYVKVIGPVITEMFLGGGLSGPNPTRTFEEFMRGLFCVNCATQEEVETFYTWCNHFGLTWASGNKVISHDDKTRNRFIMDRMPGNKRRMFYNAMQESPTVNFSDIIPPVKPEPPKPTYTLEGFLNGEFCVNFDSNEERGILFDLLYDRLDWSRSINQIRTHLRGLYQSDQQWYVVRNAHKGTKELFTGADEKNFPAVVKFKDMNLFSADIFGAGNVAVCFDGDTRKDDLLYFFAWCRKHGFSFLPSWEFILNSDFIYDAGYIIMIDGLLYYGHQLTNRDRTDYRIVNFNEIKHLLGGR